MGDAATVVDIRFERFERADALVGPVQPRPVELTRIHDTSTQIEEIGSACRVSAVPNPVGPADGCVDRVRTRKPANNKPSTMRRLTEKEVVGLSEVGPGLADLVRQAYLYWSVDDIHSGLRSENSDGLCLPATIGLRPDGRKERVAIGDGYRDSEALWRELLLDLKARVLQDGRCLQSTMEFWAALEEVFPATRGQRCRFHKMGNVLNALLQSLPGRTKADLRPIWMVATRAGAHAAYRRK
jgi:hypothetical protein